MLGSVLGVVSNVALNLALYPVLGYRGVALGTSLAAAVNFAVLVVAWRRRHGGLAGSGVAGQLGRVILASLALAAASWAAERGIGWLLPGSGPGRRFALAFGPIGAGALAYLAAARALRISELDELVRVLFRSRSRLVCRNGSGSRNG